jgi:hypothetical protein
MMGASVSSSGASPVCSAVGFNHLDFIQHYPAERLDCRPVLTVQIATDFHAALMSASPGDDLA